MVVAVGAAVAFVALAPLINRSTADDHNQPTQPTVATPIATEPSATTVSPTAGVSPTPIVTPSPTAAPSPVRAQDWTVIVHGIRLSEPNAQFPPPEPGNVYWILDVSVTNEAAVSQAAGWGWRLQDNGQFTHEAEVFPIQAPRLHGDIPPHGTGRGYLAFQLKDGLIPIAVLFQGGTFGSGEVTTIKLPRNP
jgi:hypothetical protein